MLKLLVWFNEREKTELDVDIQHIRDKDVTHSIEYSTHRNVIQLKLGLDNRLFFNVSFCTGFKKHYCIAIGDYLVKGETLLFVDNHGDIVIHFLYSAYFSSVATLKVIDRSFEKKHLHSKILSFNGGECLTFTVDKNVRVS